MRNILTIFAATLISLSLSACGGLDLDSTSDGNTNSDQIFTTSELAFNVVYSSLLLNSSGFSNSRDGFIVLFNSSSDLDEIALAIDDNDNALVGNYPWDIVNDDLQVIYPDGVTCESSKTSETATMYTATSNCEGGEPENDRITNTINIPVFFEDDDIETRSINIQDDNEDDEERIDFFSNGTFEVTDLDSNGDDIEGTTQVGTYGDSDTFNNVITLENTTSNESRLFVLLEGSLTSGTMLEIRYSSFTRGRDTLQEIRIHVIEANDQWETDSVFDDIDIDL